MTSALDIERAARLRAPPAPPTYLQVARRIRLPDGRAEGQYWDPATEPSQIAYIQIADDPRWTELIDVGPSQRGKSLRSVLLPLIRSLCELSQAVIYVMPSLDKIDQHWHGKLRPALAKAGYSAWLPTTGPGSAGGRASVILFRNPETGNTAPLYFQAMGGGGKETSLASNTAPVVVCDEADDAQDEGHFGLVRRRTRSFGAAGYRICYASTINDRLDRDAHPILAAWREGTRSRMWFACPFCGRFQALEWDRVKFDDIESRYSCVHCPALWTETDRQMALRKWRLVHQGQDVDAAGQITGPAPTGRTFSLRTWDLDYHSANLDQVVEEARAARRACDERGDHTALRQFHHKVLVLEYDGDRKEAGDDLTWQYLLGRSQTCIYGPARATTDRDPAAPGHTYSRHLCAPPPEAYLCALFVDVQHNRVYWTLIAMALDGTTWDVAWGYELARADAAPWNTIELHALLDRVNRIASEAAQPVPLAIAGLDVGDQPDQLMPWLAGHRATWVPCKGIDRQMKAEPGDLDGLVWIRDGLHLTHVDHSRDLVHAALRRPNGQPGAAHLPNGLLQNPSDTAYLRHLVGELQIIDRKTGKPKLQQRGRWDWLDCRRGAHVLALLKLRRMTAARPPSRRYGVVGKALA